MGVEPLLTPAPAGEPRGADGGSSGPAGWQALGGPAGAQEVDRQHRDQKEPTELGRALRNVHFNTETNIRNMTVRTISIISTTYV